MHPKSNHYAQSTLTLVLDFVCSSTMVDPRFTARLNPGPQSLVGYAKLIGRTVSWLCCADRPCQPSNSCTLLIDHKQSADLLASQFEFCPVCIDWHHRALGRADWPRCYTALTTVTATMLSLIPREAG